MLKVSRFAMKGVAIHFIVRSQNPFCYSTRASDEVKVSNDFTLAL
jgi:hypothetical protein